MRTRKLLALLTSVLLVSGGLAVTAAGPALADTCHASGATGGCGPYTDSGITMSDGYNTYVNNDCWADPSCSQDITATDASNWSLSANTGAADNTSVESYPNTQQLLSNWGSGGWNGSSNTPLADVSALSSDFSETMPHNSGTIAEAAYDIWTNYSADIMVWTDTVNRCNSGGYGGTTLATGVSIGGKTYDVYRWGGAGAEIVFVEEGSGGAGTCANDTSGTVSLLGVLNWVQSHGYVRDITISSIDFGWELCSTGGSAEDFSMSGYTLTATAGADTSAAPETSTSSPTAISGSDATLNGSVNPEGESTTYQFDYGTTTSYGSSTSSSSAGSGTSTENENATLSSLTPDQTYHYRIEATNSNGTSYGPDEEFTAGNNTPDTVTANATNGYDSVVLHVYVVDGAAGAGTVVSSGGYGTPEFSLTPAASHSLLLGSVENESGTTAVTPASDNTTDDSGVSDRGYPWWFGHYTGTVTGGTAATLGGTDTNGWNARAGYEAEPAVAGVSPAVDSSTPATAVGSSTSATTSSFSPPAGSELVAVVHSMGSAAQAISVSDSNGLTWTQQGSTYSAGYEGTTAVFTAPTEAAVSDRTFSDGTDGMGDWLNESVSQTTDAAYTGTHSLKVSPSSEYWGTEEAYDGSDTAVTAGHTYLLTVEAKAASDPEPLCVVAHWVGSGNSDISTTELDPLNGNDSASAWTQYQVDAAAPAGAVKLVWSVQGDGDSTQYIGELLVQAP